MDIEKELLTRSNSSCELCGAKNGLTVYAVQPSDGSVDKSILVCDTCSTQIKNPEKTVASHWRCLNESMWSTVSAVQVVAWRMLNRLKGEGWPQDLLDMLYLDETTLAWAQSGGEATAENDDTVKHIDSNGTVLQNGDTVVIIKDLDIKGSLFAAKRGTSVRNINLVWNNAEQIEGRVNGQEIVILTKYVKKAG